MERFWIYMLECENGAYYVGYSTNLTRRLRQHIDGTAGVRYTRSFKPVRVSQCWRLFGSVGAALKVERLIKKAGRGTKERFVREPAALREYAAGRLDDEMEIYTFDPRKVEAAARALDEKEVRDARDPFARLRRRDH
jgi:putative endonuclease